MTLGSPYHIRVETPKEAFSRTMSEMRTWLDDHKIQTSAGRSRIAVDIRFEDQHHASLFKEKFVQVHRPS